MTKREEIVAISKTWLGTKWHHQCMRKNVGADCIGFIAGVGQESGILVDAQVEMRKPEYRSYGRDPNPELLYRACSEYLKRIKISQATLADILVFKVKGGVYPQHFGMVTALDENKRPYYVIHSSNIGKRCVVENRIDKEWRSRLVAAFQFRGLECN